MPTRPVWIVCHKWPLSSLYHLDREKDCASRWLLTKSNWGHWLTSVQHNLQLGCHTPAHEILRSHRFQHHCRDDRRNAHLWKKRRKKNTSLSLPHYYDFLLPLCVRKAGLGWVHLMSSQRRSSSTEQSCWVIVKGPFIRSAFAVRRDASHAVHRWNLHQHCRTSSIPLKRRHLVTGKNRKTLSVVGI